MSPGDERAGGDGTPRDDTTTRETEYGEAWTYESIVGAFPGFTLSDRVALAVQFVLFEGSVLVLAAIYDLWNAVPAGTAAVVVATAGSGLMLTLGGRIRTLETPEPYNRLLFGSSIEVVLGVLSFTGLITYLFVVGPRRAGPPLFESLLGPTPPPAAVFLTLLILWDLCYRIGTGWWASVTGLWFVVRYRDRLTPRLRSQLRPVSLLTIAFAVLQLLLVPFVRTEPLLVVAIVGHVVAVAVVSGSTLLAAGRLA